MNAMAALRQYQTVNTQAQVADASPHRLIQLLMEAGLSRLAQAKGAMLHGHCAQKGELISKAIGIIGGLREGLDLDRGGEIAINLDQLYAYMITRLIEANISNEPEILEELQQLLGQIKVAWDAIG